MLPSIIRFIQHWKRYGRVVQELSRLSERELADIGIARCDIDRIARERSASRSSGKPAAIRPAMPRVAPF